MGRPKIAIFFIFPLLPQSLLSHNFLASLAVICINLTKVSLVEFIPFSLWGDLSLEWQAPNKMQLKLRIYLLYNKNLKVIEKTVPIP